MVARTTRNPGATSIIATRHFERFAKYSVWPVKAMPASLMIDFCTGAVTTASNSPSRQPSFARASVATT